MWRILLFNIHFILLVSINLGYSYNLRQLGGQNGLSNSSILSIYQDSEGCFWFGTCDGLNFFSGLKIKEYSTNNQKETLSGNLIEDILETEKGVFWVHTNYGLNKLDLYKNTVEHFKQFSGKYHLLKNENNLLILRGSKGVYYYNKSNHSFELCNLNLVMEDISAMFFSSDDLLQVFTKDGKGMEYKMVHDNGIVFVENGNFQHPSKILYAFEEKTENNPLYFIDDTYTLYEYSFPDKKKSYIKNLQKEIIGKGEVSSVVKLHNDYFIAFKTNGLLRLVNTPDRPTKYDVYETEIKSGVFCMTKDRYQDLLWIGTDGQGVFLYSNDAYSFKNIVFNNSNVKITKPVRSFFLDAYQNLWVGTKGDGIVKIRNYNFNRDMRDFEFEILNSGNTNLLSNSVYAFAPSQRNILWIGTEEGLNYYSFKENKIIKTNIHNEALKYIHAICEINDSTLWLSTVGNGIVQLTISGSKDQPVLQTIKTYTLCKGDFSSNYFYTIFQESATSLLFGNRGLGVFRLGDTYQEPCCIQYDTVHNPTVNDIYAITGDPNQNLWFGTAYGLVKKDATGQTKLYNLSNDIPNKSIHGLLQDNKSNIWISTNSGVIHFNPQKEISKTYNQLNGLQVTEYSDGAYYKDEKSGLLFFGGINGFICINEENYIEKEYIPSIHLNELILSGRDCNLYQFMQTNKALKLDYNENYFTLTFNAIDYLDENNYDYYYMPEGLSKYWMDNGSSNQVSFTNLSPGKYTLHLKCRNRFSGIESPVYSVDIYITPPWYLNPSAQFSYVALSILFLSFLLLYIRNRRKKRVLQLAEQVKHQRKEEIYESKLQFFTNIAHEFSTPLTLIYGPCDKIADYKNSDSFIISCTKQIRRNTDRLNDLIQEIIEFRRIETENRLPQIQELNIIELIGDVLELFENLVESKNIQLSINLPETLMWNTDKGFLITIFTNLLSNSFKYTPNGGDIHVSIQNTTSELILQVSNTGKGIKEEDLPKIFDRYKVLSNFETGKTEFSRNGLGLSISYNMVKLLGGEIRVESVLNKKTSFSVVLPSREINIHESDLRLPDVYLRKAYWTPENLPEYNFDKAKASIVVIDDDMEMLKLICDTFAESFNVVPLNKPLDLNKMLLEFHPDLIISDIVMSDIDGISLTREIKANTRTSHIPLILISGKQTVEEQINGLNAGAEMYITKPFNIDYLKASVEKLLNRKETLKDYYSSPISAFNLTDGKLEHKENKVFINKIRELIEENIGNDKLSSGFLADHLNISSRNLYRKLNEMDSPSPTVMIKEYRLQYAAKLLVKSKLTIDEIIFKSGFSNRGTFFKAFSEKYKHTPKEYRSKHQMDILEE